MFFLQNNDKSREPLCKKSIAGNLQIFCNTFFAKHLSVLFVALLANRRCIMFEEDEACFLEATVRMRGLVDKLREAGYPLGNVPTRAALALVGDPVRHSDDAPQASPVGRDNLPYPPKTREEYCEEYQLTVAASNVAGLGLFTRNARKARDVICFYWGTYVFVLFFGCLLLIVFVTRDVAEEARERLQAPPAFKVTRI